MRRYPVIAVLLCSLTLGFVVGCSDDSAEPVVTTTTTRPVSELSYCEAVIDGREIFASNRTQEEKAELLMPYIERAQSQAPEDIQEAYGIYYLGEPGDIVEAQTQVDEYNASECGITNE